MGHSALFPEEGTICKMLIKQVMLLAYITAPAGTQPFKDVVQFNAAD